MNIFVP